MNKNSGEKSSYRGLGSIDFQAAARSVLVVGRIKDDPTLRVVCPAKSSLAPEGGAVAFRLDPEQGFQWAGPYDISVDELLSGSSRGHKLREAQSFLKEVLADGPLPQTEIEAAAQQAGIRPKTLRNARYELGVTSTKISKQWVWALPKHKGRGKMPLSLGTGHLAFMEKCFFRWLRTVPQQGGKVRATWCCDITISNNGLGLGLNPKTLLLQIVWLLISNLKEKKGGF